MSQSYNLTDQFVPIRERRESPAGGPALASLNAELVHGVNGCETATLVLNSNGANFTGTVSFFGTLDDVNYFPVLAYTLAANGGVVSNFAEPRLLEAFAGVIVVRQYVLNCAGFRSVRAVLTAYTSGGISARFNSETTTTSHPALTGQPPSTLVVSAVGAVSAAVTASLPAVPGLRHYIDSITIVRSATAALTASATPVTVTTTNVPSALAFTFGADAGGIGVDKIIQHQSFNLACSTIGVATTFVAPVYTGVIWRINITYHLGI
jgi:hypothetical protein